MSSTSSRFAGNVLAVGAVLLSSTGPTLVGPNGQTTVNANIFGGGTFPPRHGFSSSAGTVQGGGPETNYSNKLGSMVTTNLRMLNTKFLTGDNTGTELVYNTNVDKDGISQWKVLGSNNARPTRAPGIEKQVQEVKFITLGTGYVAGTVVGTSSSRLNALPLTGSKDGGSGLTLKILSIGSGGAMGEVKIMNPGQGYEISDSITVISTGIAATMNVSQLVPAHVRTSGCNIPDQTLHIHGNANYTFASFGNPIFPK